MWEGQAALGRPLERPLALAPLSVEEVLRSPAPSGGSPSVASRRSRFLGIGCTLGILVLLTAAPSETFKIERLQ